MLPALTHPAPLQTAPHPDPQSLLSPLDKTRCQIWLTHDLRLPELAETCETSVVELALWAAQPHITAILDQVRHVAAQRSQTLYAEAKHAAIARLVVVIRDEPNHEIARRAADRILRPNIGAALNQDFDPLAATDPSDRRDDRAYHLVATRSKVVLSSAPPSSALPLEAPDMCITWAGANPTSFITAPPHALEPMATPVPPEIPSAQEPPAPRTPAASQATPTTRPAPTPLTGAAKHPPAQDSSTPRGPCPQRAGPSTARGHASRRDDATPADPALTDEIGDEDLDLDLGEPLTTAAPSERHPVPTHRARAP